MSKLPKDPSGVVVHNQNICIVGNRSNKRYFRFDSAPLQQNRVLKLTQLKLIESPKVDHKKAEDLESIEVLDDEIVVLSENSSRILSTARTVIDYSNLANLKERESRGLEGMSIQGRTDESARVAVVWEGSQKRGKAEPQLPKILVHQIGRDALGTKLILRPDYWESRAEQVKIHAGKEPESFRVPDLVWCWSDSSGQCLLLLLSHYDEAHEKYLQVFDEAGNPIGDVARLTDLGMPESLLELNWEGLCWYTDSDGKSHLLLVNDTDQESEMYLCKIQAPPEIRPA